MRVLMISDSDSFGGERTYINSLVGLLRQNNHQVYFFRLSQDKNCQDEFNKIIIYQYKNKVQWFFAENVISFRIYRMLRRYLKEVRPDIIHFHNIYKSTKSFLLACRGFKKIQTVHDFGSVCPLPVLTSKKNDFQMCLGAGSFLCFRRAGLKWQTILLDYGLFGSTWLKKKKIKNFICPSAKLADLLQKSGFKNVVFLPYFSDLAPSQSELKQNYSPEFLYVGRLTLAKGVDYLLKAFKITLNQLPNLKLKIVGDGEEKDNLIKLAEKLNLTKAISFTGAVERERLSTFYQNCLAVVIPSVWQEMFGLVALEAMSFGKPIVAFNSGALSEVVHDGVNGFLVKKFDVRALAAKMVELVQSPTLARKLGQNGQRFLRENFAKQMHLIKIVDLYKSL